MARTKSILVDEIEMLDEVMERSLKKMFWLMTGCITYHTFSTGWRSIESAPHYICSILQTIGGYTPNYERCTRYGNRKDLLNRLGLGEEGYPTEVDVADKRNFFTNRVPDLTILARAETDRILYNHFPEPLSPRDFIWRCSERMHATEQSAENDPLDTSPEAIQAREHYGDDVESLLFERQTKRRWKFWDGYTDADASE